jgi:hypothetical protein
LIGGRVLDTSALADFATGKSVYAQALVWLAVEQGIVLAVPTGALLKAWSTVPPSAHQPLAVLLGLPVTVTEDLDAVAAREAGLMSTRSSDEVSLTARHVAWSARRRGWPVVTAEAEALHAVDPELDIERLP